MLKTQTVADMLAARIDFGQDDIQAIIDAGDFPSAAVRTVAETGDFRVRAGKVHRVQPDPATWFAAGEPAVTVLGAGEIAVPVVVTDQLLDGRAVRVPLAVGNHLTLARGQSVGLRTDGPAHQVVKLDDDHVTVGPVSRPLALLGCGVGDRVQLVFGADRSFEVRRG